VTTNDLARKGGFTLPSEAGYEDLTWQLAERWGADAIRDSDGTVLSNEIVSAGFDIYSTICLVRIDNEWARANMDKLQQNYLMSHPVLAEGDTVRVDLLSGYFREQFRVNTHDDPQTWWQVFDRTSGEEVSADRWDFDAEKGLVAIRSTEKWHSYAVNFLAYRIWEAISMYNHITNDWGDREHLMPIDPIYPETQAFILGYLKQWLQDHPRTKVVRFTSMFYNFAWFWGDPEKQRYLYSDWGAYDNTVSPYALREFSKAKGYELTSEDFVNNGSYCSSHNVPSRWYLDWIGFMNGFVVAFGRKCIDLVHEAGKKAYMFYDDHWIGTEPYSERFQGFDFDGIIKCVFNGFEARKCAGVRGVKTRELRLHPYLFPTGLKGEPTFKEGGNPALDCKNFWINIRRALLREPVDRIGLGGYLHLVQDFPDFVKAIEDLGQEFRTICDIHRTDRPYTAPFKIAVLTSWGRLRSWICSGHMIHGLELNEIIESLSGLPFDVVFIDFDDLLTGALSDDIRVIINCGRAYSAWSGGSRWKDERMIERITDWVAQGGGFVGVAEPSACKSGGQFFQLSHLLGVDREIGRSLSRGKLAFRTETDGHFLMEDVEGEIDFGQDVSNIFVTSEDTRVLAAREGSSRVSIRGFKSGRSVYLSGFRFSPQNTRLLHRALYWAAGHEREFGVWTCSNIYTECAYYPGSGRLIVINNSHQTEKTNIRDALGNRVEVYVEPQGIRILDV
jgi:beta-D-galactosyl-(1->4)-L-rhamnose phosphorylase